MARTRPAFTPTIRARLLGERLRKMREDRGLALNAVAPVIGVEFSTLARYERTDFPFPPNHVSVLLDYYGIHDVSEREELIGLSKNAWRINYWNTDDGHKIAATTTDPTIIDLPWVQERAIGLCTYAPSIMPDLLCTYAYVDAIVRLAIGDHSSEQAISGQIRLRVARQSMLDGKPRKQLTVILAEAVLRRTVDKEIQVAQLEHLGHVAERPHINIRVLPDSIGWHEGLYGAFTVCQMERPYPPVALIEHLGGRMIVEDKLAERYDKAFEHLIDQTLNPTQSIELINKLAAELG